MLNTFGIVFSWLWLQVSGKTSGVSKEGLWSDVHEERQLPQSDGANNRDVSTTLPPVYLYIIIIAMAKYKTCLGIVIYSHGYSERERRRETRKAIEGRQKVRQKERSKGKNNWDRKKSRKERIIPIEYLMGFWPGYIQKSVQKTHIMIITIVCYRPCPTCCDGFTRKGDTCIPDTSWPT